MDNSLLEVKTCFEAGYHPQVYFEGWRTAFLNDTPKFHRENICDMQRHNTSDEVFCLLSGRFSLLIGDGKDWDVGNVEVVELQPYTMYNVKKGVWHTHITGENSQVLIIENANVSDENSDHTPFRLE